MQTMEQKLKAFEDVMALRSRALAPNLAAAAKRY